MDVPRYRVRPTREDEVKYEAEFEAVYEVEYKVESSKSEHTTSPAKPVHTEIGNATTNYAASSTRNLPTWSRSNLHVLRKLVGYSLIFYLVLVVLK